MNSLREFSAPMLLLLAAGCASMPSETGFDEVQRLVSQGTDQTIHWRQGGEQDAAVDGLVDTLLSAPLSAEAAVQIALLENRSLQATYESVGIAQADLVQAGLLHNPVFSASARFADRSPAGTNLEFDVVQNFLDLLVRPTRQQIVRTQLQGVQASVAAAVLDLATEVRLAYYEALGAEQVAALRKLIVDAAQAAAELAGRLHEAGNISDLQLTNELGLYESARVAWARAEAGRLAAREQLTRELGLWGPRSAWTLPDKLPEIPPAEPPFEDLESRAIAGRLDLAAARLESDALASALGVSRDWRFLAVADVGLLAERDTDGQWLVGPGLSLELPLFDRRQAELARLTAELRRADHRVVALAVEIRSQVRAARERLIASRRLAEHYRDVVIPLRETAVALTKQEHDFMLVGAFELIASKQAEYDAYQEYVEAVRDYWLARAELTHAVGVTLPTPAQPETGQGHAHPGHEGN